MPQADWLADPLASLIAPVDAETFFRDHYEKRALIAHRDEPDRYAGLLSIDRVDALVASLDLRAGALDMARSDPPVRPEDFTFETGHIDRGGVAEQYRRGATVILPQLHMSDPVLGTFCRAMEARLSCHVQTNIYLTPPHHQGFKTHYDDHDVFVLQVSGEKAWRLYDMPVENPYRGEGFRPEDHAVGEPVDAFVLKAGDCAYVPRGLMHDATTHGAAPSLHITLGLIVKTWADLVLEAVSEVALRDPAFRRPCRRVSPVPISTAATPKPISPAWSRPWLARPGWTRPWTCSPTVSSARACPTRAVRSAASPARPSPVRHSGCGPSSRGGWPGTATRS